MKAKQYYIQARCYDKRGHLISVGFNSYTKTHPLMEYLNRGVGHPEQIYLHAEVAAILRAKDKSIYRIVVERFDAKGNPANAKPCRICQKAIKMFGIKIVEHT